MPQKQSLAIAYAMKRKAQKKAEGGQIMDQSKIADPAKLASAQDSMRKAFHYADGGFIGKEKASGYVDHKGNNLKPNAMAINENDKDLNQHMVDMHASETGKDSPVSNMMGMESEDLSDLDRYAMGGELAGHVSNEQYVDNEDDLVNRIMHKRSQSFSGLDRYSEGGKVANATPIVAGFKPNEFDDLVLRDDLKSSYGDDDNSGDALGNAQEDKDRKDIVARIMASRRKKDRLPSPA